MARASGYKVVQRSSDTFIVTREGVLSNSNSSDGHLVLLSVDHKRMECDCIRIEPIPCAHLLAVASFTKTINLIFSSPAFTLMWFHSCFLQASVSKAYEVLIDPCTSDCHTLVPDTLQHTLVTMKVGRPQVMRFASTGAAETGDYSGAKFRACSNCGDREHTLSLCKFDVLGPKDKAAVIAARFATANVVVLKAANTVTKHDKFEENLRHYVSTYSLI